MSDIDLIVHGHFYQPPRENPWTDCVEPEPGARPFDDWNQRIDAECYRPNAFARIVDEPGRIDELVNNYELVSFNFGATLMRWLERNDPLTLAQIIAADRRSARARGGHGNAIAQAYSHAILPLCNARDRATQIRWGLADFTHRFGRAAEALWLPETAADPATLDALIDHGLRYAILAPAQAARVRRSGDNALWQDVRGGRVDPSRPYRYRHADGSGRALALFFYDGPIARSVAFGDALSESRRLIELCVSASAAAGRSGALVHLAVDGETWGHHHAWGDRALGYALAREAAARGLHVTNYAALLDGVTPNTDVELELGADGLGSAWSCAHGLGRWTRDCGCRIAQRDGWTQSWRGPLRAAFDLLRDAAAEYFQEEGGALWRDPWAARDAYVAVILNPGEATRAELLREHGRGQLAGTRAVRALQLLELQHMLLLMYASCGWFFDDVAGLESVQVMRYAARAVDLWERLEGQPPTRRFLDALSAARSNDPRAGTGADLFLMRARAGRVPAAQIVSHVMMGAVRSPLPERTAVGFSAVECSEVRMQRNDAVTLATAAVRLMDERTGAVESFEGAMLHGGGLEFHTRLRTGTGGAIFHEAADALHAALPHRSNADLIAAMTAQFGEHSLGAEALLPGDRRALLEEVFGGLVGEAARAFAQLYGRSSRLIEGLDRLGLELPRELRVAAELTLGREFEHAVGRGLTQRDPREFARALAVIERARESGVELDREQAVRELSGVLATVFASWGPAASSAGGSTTAGSSTIAGGTTTAGSSTTAGGSTTAGDADHAHSVLADSVATADAALDLATRLALALDLHRAQELYYHHAVASGWSAGLSAADRARVRAIGLRLGFSPRLLDAQIELSREAAAAHAGARATLPTGTTGSAPSKTSRPGRTRRSP